MATKAGTRGHVSCFGHPFPGTGNEVIAINMCIEEFGICLQNVEFSLEHNVFLFTRRQLGFDVGSWLAGGALSNAVANWAFFPRLQSKIFNFILILFDALRFNTKGTK